MGLFNLSSKVFGLDIGDLSLKIVLLEKKKNKIRLISYGEKAIPLGYFAAGEIKKEIEIAKIIKDFVKQQKISTPYVVSVLPETKTFIKTFETVPSEKANLQETIKKEIELYVPFKIEEVYFDWKIVSRESNKIKVLVGVAPKNIVDSYLHLLKMAGLKPLSLEIESVAILDSLLDKKETSLGPLAVLDLGATRSSLIMVDGEVIQLTISLPHAGANLTQIIADELKLSFEEAQKIKKDFCENPKDSKNEVVAKNIKIFFNNLTQSLINHLKFYEENSGKKITKIIVCGGGANLPGLVPHFEENLKIKTIKGNPWVNIFVKEPPISASESLIYTTAIGLALRGLEEQEKF